MALILDDWGKLGSLGALCLLRVLFVKKKSRIKIMSNNKTLIIFDIDGTLLYSNKVDSECFAQTYEEQFGKEFPTIDWSVFPAVTDHTIFNTVIEKDFGRRANPEDIEKQRYHFVELLKQKRVEAPEEFMEVPGAVNTVEQLLGDDQYVLGIATGGWQAPARVKLNHLGFSIDKFHASYADNKDTREAIVSESIEKARAAHEGIERIVYIGDAIWDVKTTRNMGIDFVGVRLKGDHEVLTREGAGTVIQDYLDHGRFLESVKEAKVPR